MKGLSTALGLASISLTACGGDSSRSCPDVAACGGTIAPGRYKITSYCATANAKLTSPSCAAGISFDLGGLKLTGTVTFNADMTYQSTGMASGTITQVIPASCLVSNGVPLTCVQLDQAVKAQGSSSGMTGSCSGSGDCTCVLTLNGAPSMAEGIYLTNGLTLTISPKGGETSLGDYCAKPTELRFHAFSMPSMMGMPGVPGAESTTVMVKE
jgi:hypothetical protein